ncbi:glycosyltransferase [Winogradskyella sp. F6397]|uniref:Glycosyltransferase n=1 Tax=Winogradskyella marina TaxID=2785530 RepID=A0ABS0EKS6_9FLAO|nr:glycosyltransferase family 2 protein [Winogradskyella marina]MBF8150977.1 glycosyltransferase [Winogradskyella marina]
MLISIITINYNDLEGLQKTMKSVLGQTYTDIEYIIIDGGSEDGSKAYIESCEQDLAYWVSEPDNGIYNAMNKGIAHATGDYLLFLNSGDWLLDDLVIENFVNFIPVEDIIYGKIKWIKEQKIWDDDFSNKITFKYFSKASLPHQGSFIKHKLFREIGNYDEKLKITSDWKFFVLAIYKYNCSFKRINMFISMCNRDGLSCLPESWPLILKEREETMKTYFPAFYSDLAIYENVEEKLLTKIHKLKRNQRFWISKALIKIFK